MCLFALRLCSHVITVYKLCIKKIFWEFHFSELSTCPLSILTVMTSFNLNCLLSGKNINYYGTKYHWGQCFIILYIHFLNVTIWACLYYSWKKHRQRWNFPVIEIYCWRLISSHCWPEVHKCFTTVGCCMCTGDLYLTATLIHLLV